MDRVAFSLFGIDVMWYGIFIAIGMMLAVGIAVKESKRVGLKEEDIMDLALFLIPLGVLGARIYYVIFSWDQYSGNLMDILNIRGGGLAIHGGIIAGILTGFVFSRIKKIDFFKLADTVVLGVPLAQSIGRWGNFVNQEAHGGPTDLPWGIMIDGQKVHPTFLYESIWDLLIFLFIFLRRKKKKYEGSIIVEYITLYSLGRFFIEGLRTDSLMLGPIRMAQFVSLLGVVVGVVLHIILSKRSKNGI
ncbi:prolipoprotein diacylglyceryl transferase [Peptostreptococcus russellii]|uniref:Phosphatidylglycerol--prolipoprotein diacylglyceryl transferase n=1 Tax=Peptostreptococcus russellii TaxID=215200 RepID=A0A1H8E9B4_9FIRM|nr:prolipoprotein diacylglyceryl transferase [Peptostreptococcus russellii]SEN16052.1 Prolipoprotein diacylglyceryl transferase [Peptostreptococcus russellii]